MDRIGKPVKIESKPESTAARVGRVGACPALLARAADVLSGGVAVPRVTPVNLVAGIIARRVTARVAGRRGPDEAVVIVAAAPVARRKPLRADAQTGSANETEEAVNVRMTTAAKTQPQKRGQRVPYPWVSSLNNSSWLQSLAPCSSQNCLASGQVSSPEQAPRAFLLLAQTA